MPLVEADASNLEVVCAAHLSGDKLLTFELMSGVDIHEENRKALNLPDRLTAKVFVFRLLYGGSKFSYAMDPMFNHISARPDFWEDIINNYYKKYVGLAKWHKELVHGVERTGQWTSPTGRKYLYELYTKPNGQREWPRTTILNYPVQGLGADLMSLARVSLYRRIYHWPNILFCNTVHDSILLDVEEVTEKLIEEINMSFKMIPRNFEKVFGSKFMVPMRCKIKVGNIWKDLKEIE